MRISLFKCYKLRCSSTLSLKSGLSMCVLGFNTTQLWAQCWEEVCRRGVARDHIAGYLLVIFKSEGLLVNEKSWMMCDSPSGCILLKFYHLLLRFPGGYPYSCCNAALHSVLPLQQSLLLAGDATQALRGDNWSPCSRRVCLNCNWTNASFKHSHFLVFERYKTDWQAAFLLSFWVVTSL